MVDSVVKKIAAKQNPADQEWSFHRKFSINQWVSILRITHSCTACAARSLERRTWFALRLGGLSELPEFMLASQKNTIQLIHNFQ